MQVAASSSCVIGPASVPYRLSRGNEMSANKVKGRFKLEDMTVKVGPQRFSKLLSFEYYFILTNQ